MLFIGSGALLYRAIAFSRNKNYEIEAVICPERDGVAKRLHREGIPVFPAVDPVLELSRRLINSRNAIVFSINNNQIIGDQVLMQPGRFFNIHNGLVQRYRGLAEVCIFAAICRGDLTYGATLHKLFPGQKVDSGPIVDQLCFPITQDDTFQDVLERSFLNCQILFEKNIEIIMEGSETATQERLEGYALSYLRLPDIVKSCVDADRLSRASHLGKFAGMFPELNKFLQANIGQQSGS